MKYKVTTVLVTEIEANAPNIAAAVVQTGLSLTMALSNMVVDNNTFVEPASGLVKV